jgi:GntR family transcriptional regulator
MQDQWNDDQPIYRQLRDRMVGLILEGAFVEGDAIPSVRTVSADYQINHLTVSKAYQALVDEGLVEKRRGLGMFVVPGAQKKILHAEKTQFLTVELPKLLQRIEQLGISREELLGYFSSDESQPVSREG